jgi:hypothetical protein
MIGSLKEVEHARDRRAQRDIDKKDLEAALIHGREEPCMYGRKYYYKGVHYVIHRTKKKEITCYADKLPLKRVQIPKELIEKYEAANEVVNDPSAWKSHTVIIVDVSGSMRKSDIWGARCRLDAVWICVALDFIAHRIESGAAGSYDVLSLVAMGDIGEILMECVPTTWETYNHIVDIYNKKGPFLVPPRGHGRYVPSLDLADELLKKSKSSSCALALCFMSDGRPSDQGRGRDAILESVESLSTRFGRRLSFSAIGIGNDTHEFEMLHSMVDTASDFGVQSSFVLPSMTTSSLGMSLTSTATTLTKTQTEMTDLKTLKQRNVRDVLRESRTKASEEVVTFVSSEDYWLYPEEHVVRRVYKE